MNRLFARRMRNRVRGLPRLADANAMIEFAVALPLLLMLVLGVLTAGVALDRYITVIQLGRNAASMFARDMDFSVDKNKDLLLKAAGGMSMTRSGGRGVIYLTRVTKAPAGTANAGQLVIAERYVIGNASLASSSIGQPAAQIWPDPTKPLPNGDVKDRNEEPSAVGTVPPAFASMAESDSIYVAEVYHDPDDLLFAGSWMFKPNWISTRVVF